ncbi:MAG: hypothetical protein C0594_09205 [Marinilabiliales bacterium]|nr:MAG: hypothetical protein C0594_09205 [Marinilabiliales bacterium]
MTKIIKVLFVILFLVFVSCTKEEREQRREDNLLSGWELVHLTVNQPYETWTFDTANVITRYVDGLEGEFYQIGNYVLSQENYKYYVTIDSMDMYIDGKFLILDLDERILVMERIAWEKNGNPFLRKEFIKIN